LTDKVMLDTEHKNPILHFVMEQSS